MTVKTGGTWSGLLVCKDATGALATPSVGPVGTLYIDGTASTSSVSVSGANPYKWTLTLPSLTAGQVVSMYVTATIATIATAGVVAEDTADTYLVSDIEALVDDIGAAGAGLTALPWNAAWDAEVQSEVTDALNAYDPPTNAEMEARTLVSAGYASPTNITAGTITTVTGSVGSLATQAKADVNAEVVDALTVDVIADSVSTDGSRPTIAQALLMIARYLMEREVSSTTVTVNKEDGTTAAMTFTLDSATAPTSITRVS
jgi:hypothetical protein